MLTQYRIDLVVAGCDESGRGCLAGPVFAAAVILPPKFNHPLLNDSKQLSVCERELLKPYIEKHALCFSVANSSSTRIDEINILNASFEAMHRAIDGLSIKPDLLLIDGNRFNPYNDIPFECIVKGDCKFASIAAASILAKVYRDAYMEDLHAEFPIYSWNTNKGYPTEFHRTAIQNYGTTPQHRVSFRLFPSPEQPTLF